MRIGFRPADARDLVIGEWSALTHGITLPHSVRLPQSVTKELLPASSIERERPGRLDEQRVPKVQRYCFDAQWSSFPQELRRDANGVRRANGNFPRVYPFISSDHRSIR